MSSRLGLLMLLVSDVPRSKAFYTEYLGLEAVLEPKPGQALRALGIIERRNHDG